MRPLVKIGESFVLHIACESFDGVQSDIDPVGVTATIIWLILIYKTTSHTEPGFSVTNDPSNDPISQKIAKNVVSEKPK